MVTNEININIRQFVAKCLPLMMGARFASSNEAILQNKVSKHYPGKDQIRLTGAFEVDKMDFDELIQLYNKNPALSTPVQQLMNYIIQEAINLQLQKEAAERNEAKFLADQLIERQFILEELLKKAAAIDTQPTSQQVVQCEYCRYLTIRIWELMITEIKNQIVQIMQEIKVLETKNQEIKAQIKEHDKVIDTALSDVFHSVAEESNHRDPKQVHTILHDSKHIVEHVLTDKYTFDTGRDAFCLHVKEKHAMDKPQGEALWGNLYKKLSPCRITLRDVVKAKNLLERQEEENLANIAVLLSKLNKTKEVLADGEENLKNVTNSASFSEQDVLKASKAINQTLHQMEEIKQINVDTYANTNDQNIGKIKPKPPGFLLNNQ